MKRFKDIKLLVLLNMYLSISRKARTKQKKILKELREMFHTSDIFDKEHYTKILMVRIYTLQN